MVTAVETETRTSAPVVETMRYTGKNIPEILEFTGSSYIVEVGQFTKNLQVWLDGKTADSPNWTLDDRFYVGMYEILVKVDGKLLRQVFSDETLYKKFQVTHY
jgi:hypothetical protein